MSKDKTDQVIISFDIGSDSVKMLKGMKKEGKLYLLDFGLRRYPPGRGSSELVCQHIQGLLSFQGESRDLRIHSTISGRKLCVRVINLPVIPRSELYQAVRSKIHNYVSGDLAQMVFSFSVAREVQEKGRKNLEVVFAAIQKQMLQEHLALFKLVEAGPELVSSACFSGWNLICELGLNAGVTSLMLINIDSQETDLTVYGDNHFIFTRNVSIGAKDFTDINGQMQNEVAVLCKEIELTAQHYYTSTHGAGIEKYITLGEGAQLAGLLELLEQKLEVPLESLHIPEERLELPADKKEEFKKNAHFYAQALGTLLSSRGQINLLPSSRQRPKKVRELVKSVFASKNLASQIIVGFVCLALAIFVLLKGINLYYRGQVKSYQSRQDKLQERTLQLVAMRRKSDVLDSEKALYQRLLESYPVYPVIIAEITQAMDKGQIVLEELRFYKEGIKDVSQPVDFSITGEVKGKYATSEDVTRFTLALENSGYFENISVSVQERPMPARRLGFVLSGRLRVQK